MNSVKVEVLFDGYSQQLKCGNVMVANCTCTLVTSKEIKVIVDTMTPWDGYRLRNALDDREISPNEITYAVATHCHSDHVGNLNMFLEAKHIVGNSLSCKDHYFDDLLSGENFRISDDIQVVSTPGHTASCISLLVTNTARGTIAITGDLFEKEQDSFDPSIWHEFAQSENPLAQIRSRVKILNLAQYIIPGHGKMFKVTDELRKANLEYMRKLEGDAETGE